MGVLQVCTRSHVRPPSGAERPHGRIALVRRNVEKMLGFDTLRAYSEILGNLEDAAKVKTG